MSSTGIIARLKGFGARQAFGDGWRELVTPEGVDLRLRVGTYADRFVALLLDFLILGGGMVALTIVAAIVGAVTRLPWMNMALGVVSEAQTAAAVLGHNYPNTDWYKDAYQLVASDGQAPVENRQSWISKAFSSLNPL